MHTRNAFNEPDNGMLGDGYHTKAEAGRARQAHKRKQCGIINTWSAVFYAGALGVCASLIRPCNGLRATLDV
jgi:hypothetical protein